MRFLIQDTNDADQQISDEEVLFLIDEHGGVTAAAVAGARVIAAKYARSVTKAVGDLRISFSDRAKQYRELALFLEADGAAGGAPLPWAGGISVADKEDAEADTDRVSPAFGVGAHDRDRRSRDPLLGSQ